MAPRSPAGPRFLVGIPGDLDLALFTFGPSGPVRHCRPFTEALAATMYQIRRMFGDDVLFQIEVPPKRCWWRARRPRCGQPWPACWPAGSRRSPRARRKDHGSGSTCASAT
jgi:hypothetical protein